MSRGWTIEVMFEVMLKVANLNYAEFSRKFDLGENWVLSVLDR